MTNAQAGLVLQHLRRLAGTHRADQPPDAHLLERFTAQRDEAAFAALVQRHGPMVLNVCRSVLRHEQDAEDAFQATFLVLAQKAASLRQPEAVAGWLYEVAYHAALRAQADAARRRTQERRTLPVVSADPTLDMTLRDLHRVVHEELRRLPEKYRLPLVLCYLEGRSQDEAASQLGWSKGTLRGRLDRGREQLRRRLAARGVTLSALLCATAVAPRVAAEALADSVVRAAVLSAVDGAAVGALSARASALAEGVTRAMFLSKLKVATAVLLAVGFLAGAGALARQVLAARDRPVGTQKPEVRTQKPEPAAAAKPRAADDKRDRVEVSGRVVDSSGKPVAGAKLFLCDDAGKSVAPQPAADGTGRFGFTLAATVVADAPFLLATADGLGLDWANIRPTESRYDLTLRLTVDVPIRGKVVDLEGKPVAGVAIRIVELTTSRSGSLDEFLKQWAEDKVKSPTGLAFRQLTEKRLWMPGALRHLPAATTGPDGTFCLSGIGRDRGLMLGVRGAGIADHYVRVVTRPDFRPRPVSQRQVALSGPELAVAVAPSKPITGTLRDAQTKKPLAGVRVLAYTPDRPIDWWWQPVETVTDTQGRYRLDGLAKAARQIVTFDPGAGAAHMHRFDEVGDTVGYTPIVHDSELHRGVVVRGRVTDGSTGRPVRARVVYAPLINNESFTRTPGYDKPRTQLVLWIDSREMTTGADGRFQLTALPGPGALFVRATGRAGQFTQPAVPKEDQDPAMYDPGVETFLTLGMGDIFPMKHLHAYRLIRPAVGAAELTIDFALDHGVRRRGRLLDPDGRPLTGAEAMNLTPPSVWKRVLPGAEFTAEALNTAKSRRLLFWHRDRKLAGTVVLRGNEPEPITVRLQPLATLTGRAIGKEGEPLVGYAVEFGAWPDLEWPGSNKDGERATILTDKEGRFRVPDLPAGVPLHLMVFVPTTRYAAIHREKIILEPGKATDLGDLRGRSREDEP
jgi:RNA polymerase sigma factor (sigma-70 family)